LPKREVLSLGRRVRELHRVAYKYEHIIKCYLKIISHWEIIASKPLGRPTFFDSHCKPNFDTDTEANI